MEGIIKSVTVEPVKLYEDDSTTITHVKVYFDAAALAAMYTAAGIDPADITAGYIVYDADGNMDVEDINLAEAAASGHEVSGFETVNVAYNAGD